MKSVIQRVTEASVSVEGSCVGRIDGGLLVYLGIEKGDTEEQLLWLCTKIGKLRVFSDERGKMNLDLRETGGSVLVVSQFTLCADLHKGNRPSYNEAALPEEALKLYELAIRTFQQQGFPTESGVFGAHMQVSYTNDGPVTMLLDA
ncbi:D-aminoacyl-tRNA deacylase [Sphaerochaeta sp. PS]|uniref:D-aminoacyl-tRNA deacylase n=1 Tax=Sphaerochaeta sp. PS TaxID=3076336 RepID=UPI0028A2E8F5|nr:D-aminoacyl-tRNA deacylase [Sphaerochaeta sp. PS]MDT4761469.1 D-aminoacyl-tRNA deacylase [Sphaerochaeta sp. PS]